MDQNMITLTMGMQFSKERLREIFEVPKTKELFEKFLSKEENKEKISELEEKFSEVSELLSEEDMPQLVPKEEVQKQLKVFVLADSLEAVVNGKSLNQAIQTNIRKQIEGPVAIEKVEEHIESLLIKLNSRNLLEDFFRIMLS